MKLNDKFIIKNVLNSVIFIEKGKPEKMIKMNRTAAEICEYAGQGAEKEEIIKNLSAKYSESEKIVRSDVEAVIEQMKELGILRD